MKRFWQNFFYGFGMASIVIVCLVLCISGMSVAEKRTVEIGFGANQKRFFTWQERTVDFTVLSHSTELIYRLFWLLEFWELLF